jgi:transcriptional regulator with XRE-family HTH domain
MISLKLSSPTEVASRLAARAKQRRLDSGMTQLELAERSGVPLGTLRLFERSGKASLEAVVKLAFVLDAADEFERLFYAKPPLTIDDVVGQPNRKRVRSR